MSTAGDVLRAANEAAAALVPTGCLIELDDGLPTGRVDTLDGWLRQPAPISRPSAPGGVGR